MTNNRQQNDNIRKVARALPMGVTIVNIETVECPFCKAQPRKACTSIKPHQARLDAFIA